MSLQLAKFDEDVKKIIERLSIRSPTPYLSHILTPSASGGKRVVLRRNIQRELEAEVDRTTAERFQAGQLIQELQALSDRLAYRAIYLQKLLCPIEALPFEIIKHIIEYAVQPQDTLQIRNICQLSATWRRVALSCSRLFVHADWARWAPELLCLWCERAKNQALSIRLYQAPVRDFYLALRERNGEDAYAPMNVLRHRERLLDALLRAMPHAERFEVISTDEPDQVMYVLQELFGEPLPKLRHLTLNRKQQLLPEHDPLTIACPNLQSLSVSGVHLISKYPLSALAKLDLLDTWAVLPQVSWTTLYGTLFTLCMEVQELCITVSCDFEFVGPKAVLPSIQKLSLRQGDFLSSTLAYKSIFDSLELPNLQELSMEIHDLDLRWLNNLVVSK
ncbi:hypothetical protein DL93DRAFT_2100520 [Clavulina sp. PMI_390]|nr:hypothetical protein DL93DRAFT_2100520 [Clavulina sp. PMI_390]